MPENSAMLELGPPVEKKGLQRTAYERIRKGILTGKIEPGGQLKIGELAKALNVSANPVREALRQLEAEGMVHFTKNRRIVVIQLSPEDLNDIYSLLIPLEEIALDKCLDFLDEPQFEMLQSYCAQMSQPDINGSEWIELNWFFHRKIHQTTGSPRLGTILQGLRNNITPYFYLALQNKPRITQANQEHNLLLAALEKKDRALAKKVMRQHLINGRLAIGELLKKEQDEPLI